MEGLKWSESRASHRGLDTGKGAMLLLTTLSP